MNVEHGGTIVFRLQNAQREKNLSRDKSSTIIVRFQLALTHFCLKRWRKCNSFFYEKTKSYENEFFVIDQKLTKKDIEEFYDDAHFLHLKTRTRQIVVTRNT